MTTKISQNLVNNLYRKNVIINGNFDIWQRGTSFAAISTGAFSADRFAYYKVGAMVHTASRSTDVPTYAESGVKSNYSLLVDCTTADTSIAAGDVCHIRYGVEGYDYAQLAGGNATLSFWVKATKTGTYCVTFRNSGNNRSYVKEYTVSVSDTWEKKTITVPLTETGGTWDYTNGAGLKISFTLASGSTYHTTADAWQTGDYYATSNQVNATDNVANNFRIAQVQFEKGDVATDFEQRHIADELAMCQRYYTKMLKTASFVDGYATASAFTMMNITFPAAMRTTPSCTGTFSAQSNVTANQLVTPDEHGVTLRLQATATGRVYANFQNLVADAEL